MAFWVMPKLKGLSHVVGDLTPLICLGETVCVHDKREIQHPSLDSYPYIEYDPKRYVQLDLLSHIVK